MAGDRTDLCLARQDRPLPGPGADDVAERADLVDRQLHDVPRFHPAVELESAAGADGARTDEVARLERLVHRGERDHLLEAVRDAPRIPLGPELAVDPRGHAELVRIADLIGSDEDRPDRRGEVLSL